MLGYHLEQMHRNSPPGSVYAFDIDRLRSADVTFWTAWDDGMLLGCGAMKDLGDGTGEVKSMRTAPDHLRKGIAAALLDHIIGVARLRGYRRLSLETGSGVAFDPALALYRRRGFTDGAAFGGYERSEFNQFLHLEL
ncbi:GNAT family N-acetyltransferase [Sphingomonas sp. SUN039]|uniref:GNAT family N-acetyltransferase n=1 Tax=Sphingomonas sp. SUN039 TaxID=2937787 RepID=UPI00286916E3|nr:GNAT family N-acetyltransferase [Sphingomonas sp. SUN039]